jgi:hypothetical protein
LFLPCTRKWSIEPVVAAFDASDIPKEVYLLLDAPDCDGWFHAFAERGWHTHVQLTHQAEPPAGRLERRARHRRMREISQDMTRNLGRVLYSEDDTLVPHDVWHRLSALLDAGYAAASGVQVGRHETRACGVWRWDKEANIMDVFHPHGIEEADAVGHYCLMITGAAYAAAPISDHPDEPVDTGHTRHLAPVAVDSSIWCGHLLESGDIVV